MKEYNKKKADQLGMPIGTASGRLRKSIIFQLLMEANKNICFQCGEKIESEKELSVEHKIPWLDSENPLTLFFDLNNIAFSHLTCNISAARPKPLKHPSERSYRNGCRCKDCIKVNTEKQRKRRTRL